MARKFSGVAKAKFAHCWPALWQFLESLKDEFGLLTSATTAPGLLKCFLNALYVRKVDVIPVQLGLAM